MMHLRYFNSAPAEAEGLVSPWPNAYVLFGVTSQCTDVLFCVSVPLKDPIDTIANKIWTKNSNALKILDQGILFAHSFASHRWSKSDSW